MPTIPSSDFDAMSVADLMKLADSETDRGRAAARVLGDRYANGNYPGLVPKGGGGSWEYRTIAVGWYRKAALIPSHKVPPASGSAATANLETGEPPTAGDNLALVKLALMYTTGSGVDRDPRWTKVLLDCAAARDHVPDSEAPHK